MTTGDGPRTTDRRHTAARRLTMDELNAIRGAIARGVRHTEIARSMNLSLWTVDRIAVEQRCGIEPLEGDGLPVDDAPADYEAKNLRRCGGCGAMVYVWPCVACLMGVKQHVPEAQPGDVDEKTHEGGCGSRSVPQDWGRENWGSLRQPQAPKRRTKRNAVYRVKMARKAG